MFLGYFQGGRFADICCGPSIHGAISTSKVFNDIYMLEYLPQNRNCVKKWMDAKEDAHDWSDLIRHAVELEGNK